MTDALPLALGRAKELLPGGKVRAQEEWFACPDWAGLPGAGTHLEVRKGDAVVDRVLVDKLPYYLVGRLREVVDIPLEHESISRAHCAFVHHRKGNLYVIDLASKYGVYVNNKRVQPKTPVKITEEDAVRIGGSSRVFRVNRNAPPRKEATKRPASGEQPGPAAKRVR
eukprot:TRINITY_DN19871_c0_g2_i1.p1 TRINITY_DN19871_c0_g2~~TRINITY_DN19871_c0_g2_i1.p1  ORF type:complete len:168 (+),score=42.86 TRINITY_DN19871_c0_g2_i1:69-572(+)